MPFTQSNNVTAQNNEQPEYSVLWHPYAIDSSLSASPAIGAWMQFNSAGVGATPGPGGDAAVGTPYTVAYVDTGTDTAANAPLFAGILIGTTSLGALTPYAPNAVSGTYCFQAMCATQGIMQVLCDNTTTIGHTLNFSTSTNGCLHDSGGTAFTAGLTVATALQAVTISSGSALVWAIVLPR